MTGAMLASGDLRLLLAEIATARTLLGQLAAEVESVRQRHPGAISREALALIARADKLAHVLDPFIPGHAMIDGELQAFASFIEETVAQLEAPQ